MEKFKDNLKEIILLILILLVIAGFFYIRYSLYLRKKEALRPYSQQLTSQSAEEINAQKSTLWERIKNFGKETIHADGSLEKNKSDDTNTLLHFDVSSEYNSFIFDDRLYMFEGKQSGENALVVLNTMIEDATEDFYSNPSLTARNIGGITGTFLDGESYISNLTAVRDAINSGDTYNISFGYNKLKTYANEVIIEKN